MKKATGNKLREPARASLREMPEVNFDKAKVRRNPYALRRAGYFLHPHGSGCVTPPFGSRDAAH